jgi:ligand-binding sensor domain-containing protein/serine phosphatase RsbU (regulator of sigma subunit)
MKHYSVRIFVLTILLLCSFVSNAQQYDFTVFTTKNGLPSSNINAIYQDNKGFVWFGTDAGLAKFDGKQFNTITKDDGLIDNNITAIAEDKKNGIWVGTAEGISVINGKKITNYTTTNGICDNLIRHIFVDKDNNVWIATDNGLSQFDGKKFNTFNKTKGLSSDIIYAVCQAANGAIWLCTRENGLIRIHNNIVTNFDPTQLFGKKSFFTSYADSKGNVWFGGLRNQGVLLFDGNIFSDVKLPTEVASDFIGAIKGDFQNNIWIATTHGVLKYDMLKKSFLLLNENNGLSGNEVQTLCCDYEGKMWIGTFGTGINIFGGEMLTNYTESQGLLSNSINIIYLSKDNKFITSTQKSGLNLLQNNTFYSIEGTQVLSKEKIFTLAERPNGELWAGTENNGIFVLKKEAKGYSVIQHITSLQNTKLYTILKIHFDTQGNTWICTFGEGIIQIEPSGKIIKYNTNSAFVSNDILSLFEDSKNRIWVGTLKEGIVLIEKGKITSFSKLAPEAKTIWNIAEDENHNIYFATQEKGVTIYNGKTFRNISKEDGLCSNFVEAVVWDKRANCLWAGTNKGINKITFTKDLEPKSIVFFGEEEGFKGNEVLNNCIVIDNEGLVWFGTTNGITCYNRNYDFERKIAPKLCLSNIKLAYQNIDWHNYTDSVDDANNLPYNLSLPYNKNHLTFEFQALTTGKVLYSFQLEGADNDWSPPAASNEANFSNIAPGATYIFKVKAINNNGIESNVITYRFTIKAPWWQTWWFYAIAIMVIGASIYFYIRYRTAALAKEKKILEDKVEERTVDLVAVNQKLGLAFQEIKDSINYARVIQDAILPLDEEIKKELPNSFVLYKPRNIVSGDFYWFAKKENKIYIAAVDCTGHGVPGAFMSMIGNSLLNEIVNEKSTNNAASILNKLHSGVRKALKQDRDAFESKDGMDLSLVIIDYSIGIVEYAGAKRPMYLFLNSASGYTFEELKADKQSIGGMQIDNDFSFTNHQLPLVKGSRFYLFTDGYVDQFGGEKEKKYSSKRLKEKLTEIQTLPTNKQLNELNNTIEFWMKEVEQVDDILLLGVEL